MRIYNGPKPCAGCRKPGSEKSRIGVDVLCDDCRRFIELGKEVRANSDGYSTISLYPHSFNRIRYEEKLDGSENSQHHKTDDFRYISDGKQMDGSSKHLVRMFSELLSQMNEGTKDKSDIRMTMDDCFGAYTYTLKTPVAKAMFKFIDSVAKWGKRIDTESYSRGKNLLFGLASGEMTVKEFNEKA